MRPDQGPAIREMAFATDQDEATGIAKEIAAGPTSDLGETAVLGRTRAILQPVLEALRANSVKAFIVIRRDRFISPQFVWLQSCLDQSLRPSDRQVFTAMVDAANRIAGTELDPALLAAEAEAAGSSLAEYWALAAKASGSPVSIRLAELTLRTVQSRVGWREVIRDALVWLPETTGATNGVVTDAAEDKVAWETAVRAIRTEKAGDVDLPELLQGLALRPKEPPPDPTAVTLCTIHSAKGLEFNHVWLMGMAETVLPSWQSLQKNALPAVMEEERRNCFVAITRTRQTLVLSRASQYRGWRKEPSRFLVEMGLTTNPVTAKESS